jgi:protein TonB
MRDRPLLVCAVLSILGHIAFASGLRRLPKHEDTAPKRIVSIRVIAPPPPDPEPPPEPAVAAAPIPKAVPHERPRPRPPAAQPIAPPVAPRDTPPPDRPSNVADDSATPVFGVTMESTSQAGRGPAMPIGNSARPTTAPSPAEPAAKPLPAPVPDYEVTTMPLPQGRCIGQYTDEAKLAAIEGTVVLDLIVSETGRVRDVRVVSGLGHGLTEAAIAAVKGCRFSPGEKNGSPVPVRVRGFKIRFLLQENE